MRTVGCDSPACRRSDVGFFLALKELRGCNRYIDSFQPRTPLAADLRFQSPFNPFRQSQVFGTGMSHALRDAETNQLERIVGGEQF